MVVMRTDETWHRVCEWTYGQALSERLAAQLLLAEGFTSVDPSHPLGGRDGRKDAVALKDGEKWIMAVYFPRGKRSFGEIKTKFVCDLHGVAANGAQGMAFVTNQELLLAERRELEELSTAPVLLVHLERIVALLDQPKMYGVREQFLEIPANGPPGPLAAAEQLEDPLRQALTAEFGFLNTLGLPRDLRRGEPKLTIDPSGKRWQDRNSHRRPPA